MKIVYPTWFELQFNDNNGKPLTSGLVYTKRSDSGANAVTYNANDEPNTNPVVLDLNGRAVIRLDSSFAYKFIVHNSNDVLVYERDKVYGTEVIIDGGTGADDHTELTNRDANNQHPTSAITGLDTALSAITGDVDQLIIDVTNLEGNKVNRSGDTMTGGLNVQGAFTLQNDTSNPNAFCVESYVTSSASLLKLKYSFMNFVSDSVNVDSVSSSVQCGFGNRILSSATSDVVNHEITRAGSGDRIESKLTVSGIYNDPRAYHYVGVLDQSSVSLDVMAGYRRFEVHVDGLTDILNFPTVTGETKTLATLESPSFSGVVNIVGTGPALFVERDTSDTNLMRFASVLTHKSSVNVVDGFGVQQAFAIGDDTTALSVLGYLGFRRFGADNTGEFVLTCLNGGASVNVATGTPTTFNVLQKLNAPTSTTARAGFNIPHSTLTITPANGDIETTTAGLFARINGVTYEYAPKSFVGNLQLISLGNTAIGQNTTTNERGHLVRMVNGTGATSFKGTLISASTTTDNQFVLQANEFDAFGVVAESGIASGQECWIWVNGSTCEVLWENGQSSTRGYLAICAPTDGRALNVAVPSSNPTVGEHFKECGHVLQSKVSGTNVLVLCQIHFN